MIGEDKVSFWFWVAVAYNVFILEVISRKSLWVLAYATFMVIIEVWCLLFMSFDSLSLQLMRFSGVALGEACTVVLRGATQQILDEAERSLHDALCVLSQTVKEPRTVYGGGEYISCVTWVFPVWFLLLQEMDGFRAWKCLSVSFESWQQHPSKNSVFYFMKHYLSLLSFFVSSLSLEFWSALISPFFCSLLSFVDVESWSYVFLAFQALLIY